MRKAVLFFLFNVLLILPLYASQVEINSNYIEYDDLNQYMLAKDSVTVTWKDKKLKSNYVKYWAKKDTVQATGRVMLLENDKLLVGRDLLFNVKTDTGTLYDASGSIDTWRFRTRKLEAKTQKVYVTDAVDYTTCDRAKPHYFLSATSSKIVTGKRITLSNPLFFWSGIPVFYLPYYSQGIGKHKYMLDVQPGYDTADGFWAKIIYGYPLSEKYFNSYGKLYIDYFAKRGTGLGTQFDYFTTDGKARGTVYGYEIKEKSLIDETVENQRWTFTAENYYKINPLWTAQSRMNFSSDQTFNNAYYQDNWQHVNQQLDSSLALTRASKKSTLTIAALETNISTTTSVRDFKPSVIALPSIDYTLYPLKIGNGYYFNIQSNIINQYTRAADCYTISNTLSTRVSKAVRITRDMSFMANLGLTEAFQNRNTKNDTDATVLYNYLSGLNYRYRVTRWMDWNLSHTYSLRTKPNSFEVDYLANDYGETTNGLGFLNVIYITRDLKMQNSVGYSLLRNRLGDPEFWFQRFSNVTHELTWLPSPKHLIYLKNESTVYPSYFKSIQGLYNYNNAKNGSSLSTGLSYQRVDDNSTALDLSCGIGFWATKNWRVEYSISGSTRDWLEALTPNSQGISIYRDLHCWELKLSYTRSRNLDPTLTSDAFIETVKFMLNIKPNLATKKLRDSQIEREKEFYPWR